MSTFTIELADAQVLDVDALTELVGEHWLSPQSNP
jgi:hypothetical protein